VQEAKQQPKEKFQFTPAHTRTPTLVKFVRVKSKIQQKQKEMIEDQRKLIKV